MATRTERTESIGVLEQEFNNATGVYLTDINKINVAKITELRRSLRKSGVRYIVVKNTLAKKAMERCGLDSLVPYMKGSIGVAVTKKEGTGPAKVLKEFQKDNKELLNLKASYIDGGIFNAEQTIKIADLPSREVLLSQFLSCLQAPMANFSGSLRGILVKLAGTLESVKNKKETQQ